MKKQSLIWKSILVLCMASILVACSASKTSMPSAGYDMNMVAETAAAAEAVSPGAANLATGSKSASTVLPENRKLIRNAEINAETDEFDSLLDNISNQVASLKGYVERSNISGNSMNYRNEPIPRYASLTVRIPQEHLDGFLNQVEGMANVTSKSLYTSDVTVQYADLESRKKTLTVEQERIWAILEKADTLEAVIALEQRLSEIRYELESMESQLRLYDNQVDYSAVTIYIQEVTVTTFTPTSPVSFGDRISRGLSGNMKAVITALTNLVVWLITTSPIWIPLLIILLIALRIIDKKRKIPDAPVETSTETTGIAEEDHQSPT